MTGGIIPAGRPDRLRLALALACGLLGAPIALQASRPPDWVKPYLGDQAIPANLEGSTVALLEEASVRFLPNGRIQESVRTIVRVVSEEGVGYAGTARPYNIDTDRILKTQAWIIAPDGRHTDAYGRNDFFDVVATRDLNYWNDARVIVFGSATRASVGSIIAIEMDIERGTGASDYSWAFRSSRPVWHSIFEVAPLPGDELTFRKTSDQIPNPVPGQLPGSLRWEMQDLATMPRDLPAGFVPNSRLVMVRDLGTKSATGRMNTWQEFAALASTVIEPRMVPAPAVTAETQTLVREKKERWARIRSLTGFVQKQVNYLSVTLDKDSLAGYRPHFPTEVLQTHLGDCKDKSALLVTMLRSAGETAFPILVATNRKKKAASGFPGQIFNHMIVGIPADANVPPLWPVIDGGAFGKLVVFDPTADGTPLGTLPVSDQGRLALIVAPANTPDTLSLPAEDPELFAAESQVNGEIQANGDLSATFDQVKSGSHAADESEWRVQHGDARFRELLEAQFHATLPLLSEFKWTDDWNPVESRSHITCTIVAPRAMRHLGPDALLICPQLVSGDHPYQPWKTAWEGTVSLPALGVVEEVRLHLPEGFVVGNLPSNLQQELPFVNASLTYRLDGGTLCYTRRYFRQACSLGQTEYDSIYQFYRKLDEAERRPVILRRAAKLPGPTGPAAQ